MTALVIDVADIDAQLDRLLEHQWTAKLVGYRVNRLRARVLAPPPSRTILTWNIAATSRANAISVLCDDNFVKQIFFPTVFMYSSDQLCLKLELTA